MSHSIRRRTLLVAASAIVLAAAIVPVADARACALARVDLYDRDAGEALPVYRHAGRRYVEGRPGNEYAVRIRNCTGERLLAVLSVDGVNAVTGQTASPDQSGYVIEPWGYVTVQGWRKDFERTAAFYFSDPHDSYAARTGRPDDLGVIGVALFRERLPEPERWWSRDRGADLHSSSPPRETAEAGATGDAADGRAADAAVAAPAPQRPSLGTGHGRNEYSPVETLAFERASSRPDELIAIRYEDRETLVALGVLPEARYGRRDPEPFPGGLGFVPDP
ncbi:MAG TPA: hypothetical protein VFI92_15220 [Steroidobacteraceae bacterium]|nr:hypothetical protein [Steroidobacteraceae bacterium]